MHADQVYRLLFKEAHGEGPWPCEFCEHEVQPHELHVHHLNHDHSDNRLENLTASHGGCHVRHHAAHRDDEHCRRGWETRRRNGFASPSDDTRSPQEDSRQEDFRQEGDVTDAPATPAPGARGGARTAPRRRTGEYPRRATNELRNVSEVLRPELERQVREKGIRPAVIARVAKVQDQAVYNILAGLTQRVSLKTHGDLLEACCKIDYGEVKLTPRDFRHDWAPYPVGVPTADMESCFRGHAYTDDNVYMHGGKRRCRRCQREARKRYRERKKAESRAA